MSASRHLASLLVSALAASALIGLSSAPSAQAAPQACDGVWLVVQPDETDADSATITCVDADTGDTALEVLRSATTVVLNSWGGPAQVDGLPDDPDYSTNGGYYWAYCTAPVADTLTWSYASAGSNAVVAESDVVTGFSLTNTDDCPSVTALPQASTASPTITTTSPTPTTASPTVTTTTPTTSTSQTPTTPAASADSPSVKQAARFLTKNLPSADDGAGTQIDVALALAATENCNYAPAVQQLLDEITDAADDYLTSASRAAKAAILAIALGEDPTDFAGIDLIAEVRDGINDDGSFDTYPSAFSTSLAIIALARAGDDVPQDLIDGLLSFQDSSGGFGYEWSGTFTTDPDSTALAIQALWLAGGNDAAIAKAVSWAEDAQTAQGYWENYSPVDSTALMVSALNLVGSDTSAATSWLAGKQLSDGGFPNSLDAGTTSNLLSTSSALTAAAGSSLATVSFALADCDVTTSASPTATAEPEETLPNTGASASTLPLGVLGIGLVCLGGVALVLRRTGVRH